MPDADELHPDMAAARDRMVEDASPIIGLQRARLGADRFARFMQAHAELQAQATFLLVSGMSVAQAGYSDEALAAFRQDARDVRQAAGKWARIAEEIAAHWQAQREEHGD